MARIEALTPAQAALLPQWHREWLEIGTSTEPADRPRAEAAMTAMYREIGEDAPRFVWCDSPCTAVLAIAALLPARLGAASLGDSLRDGLGDSLGDGLGDSLWASLGDSLRYSLWASLADSLGDSLRYSLWASLADSLRASLGDSLWASLWASLRGSLGGSLRASLRGSLGGSLGDSLGDSLGASLGASRFWGAHEAYWIGYYRFAEEIGVRYDPQRSAQLRLWEDIARSCLWWWPYRGICIVSERPSVVRMEPLANRPGRFRLHCVDGPAVAFRDGWGVWAWHGTRVPQAVIESPETLTPEQIRAEENVEVRRVMLERFGYERFLRASDARLLDEDRDTCGFPRRLWWLDIHGDEPLVMIELHDSSLDNGARKTYMEMVSPDCRTARGAVAWQFVIAEREYAPAVET